MTDEYKLKVKEYLGHDFFHFHEARTKLLMEKLQEIRGHTVLEVGGFPGMLVEEYRKWECWVTTVESSQHYPEFYQGYLALNDVGSIIYDITYGAPSTAFGNWKFGIMSDVLQHIDGIPFDFIRWFIQTCETVFIIQYKFGEARLHPARKHDLYTGFPQCSQGDLERVLYLAGAGSIYFSKVGEKESERTIIKVMK